MSEHWRYDECSVAFYHEGIETDMYKVVDALNAAEARIAELEADSVQIQYICEDELPEGISDEVFSAMYACSTVDFVRVYPYITIDGHKRFLFELPEVQE